MKDNMDKGLAKTLRQIEGVIGVVITARDGIVLDHDLQGGDPEREGAVAVFVGNAASQVADSLALGSFNWGTVAMMSKDTMVIMEQPDFFVGLLLHGRVSPAIVVAEAEKALTADGAE